MPALPRSSKFTHRTGARRRSDAAWMLAVALGWLLVSLSFAQPLAVDGRTRVDLARLVQVLEDPDRTLTLDEVRSRASAFRFAPATGAADFNFGYTDSAYWLRFALAASADVDLRLEVAFPSLDEVEFHAPQPDGTYTSVVTGDLRPLASRVVTHRHFVFPIELEAGQEATYYLRVASQGSLTVPLTLWPAEAFHDRDRPAHMALAAYFGMLLALALYNLFIWFSLRDPSYLAYVAFALAMALGQASLTGIGNAYLWTNWIAWGHVALPAGFAATGFFGSLFTRRFLATPARAPLLDRVIVAHMAAFGFAILLAPFAYRWAAITTSVAAASCAVTMIAAGIVCLRRGYVGARYFLIAWTLLAAGALVMGLRNLGALPSNFITLHALQIGSACEMLLLSLALAHRIAVLTADQERLQRDALAVARRAEAELESKVATRTAELADANRRLANALGELERVAATDRLTGAWNRRWFDEAIHAEIERAQRYGHALSLIMIDIDQFKRINDRYGHARGDSVLSDLAARIRDEIRGADSLTRWGGEEFIVLAPATSLEGAVPLAEKLRLRIERSAFAGVDPITISLGVTEYRPGQRAEDVVAAADVAMYRAKQRGRNRVATEPEANAPAAIREHA